MHRIWAPRRAAREKRREDCLENRSTAVPAVCITGVSPVSVRRAVRPGVHGRDAHGTHGQDARATLRPPAFSLRGVPGTGVRDSVGSVVFVI